MRELVTPDAAYFSIELTDEQKQAVCDAINAQVYHVCHESPEFPDCPMDWACETLEQLKEFLKKVIEEGGRASWIGPDATHMQELIHKMFREESRQRLKLRLAKEKR